MRYLPHISLAAVAATLALAGTASASVTTFNSDNRLILADRAQGGPPGTDSILYPSGIAVDGLPGTVSDVRVTLKGLRSSFPGDLDLMLVSPAGRSVVLMSDAGDTHDVGPVDVTLSDDAPRALPSNEPITTGSYRPTNLSGSDGTDVFPSPAPSGPYGTKLSDLVGTDGNGRWTLWATDDASGDRVFVDGGWKLELETSEGKIFSNSTPITGHDRTSGQAPASSDPYPAGLLVTGVPRPVARVSVTLRKATFGSAPDLDLMLRAPDGRHVILASDAGLGSSSGSVVRLDDAAAQPLPDNNAINSGTFRPTDDAGSPAAEPGGVDVFPPSAPAAPHKGTLAAFAGTDANGTWSLYAVDDDANGSVNTIEGGWSLNVTPEPAPDEPVPASDPAPSSEPAATGPAQDTKPADQAQPPAPATRLALSGLKLKPATFKARKGTTIRYSLTKPAKVSFRIQRRVKGRFVKVPRGLTQSAVAGANKRRFKRRSLKPGVYRLRAKVAGAPARTARFKVVK